MDIENEIIEAKSVGVLPDSEEEIKFVEYMIKRWAKYDK